MVEECPSRDVTACSGSEMRLRSVRQHSASAQLVSTIAHETELSRDVKWRVGESYRS